MPIRFNRYLSALLSATILCFGIGTVATSTAANSSLSSATIKSKPTSSSQITPKLTAKPVSKKSTQTTSKTTTKAPSKSPANSKVKSTNKTASKTIDLAKLQEKLIILPKTDYNKEEATKMSTRIMKINAQVLQNFVNKGGKLKLITTNITGDPTFAHLKNKTPRGWEDTGLTWDDVPGIGGKTTLAKIGASDRGNGHGSINLELHELAHGLDDLVFGEVSQSKSFKKLTANDKGLFANDPYFQYPEEYFAEAFAMYYYNDDSRKIVKEKSPDVYALIQKLVKQ